MRSHQQVHSPFSSLPAGRKQYLSLFTSSVANFVEKGRSGTCRFRPDFQLFIHVSPVELNESSCSFEEKNLRSIYARVRPSLKSEPFLLAAGPLVALSLTASCHEAAPS